MADLNVERKKTPIWPLLIGAIVLALLIWGLISVFDRDEQTHIDPPAGVTTTPPATEPAPAPGGR